MKVVSIGAGPAGLYFGILMKKAFPDAEIELHERNKPDDTFGWGVVFSRETLGNLEEADAESYRKIESRFAYWDDIETFFKGERTVSTGHGFCGLSRRELLLILQSRCRELGVKQVFEHELGLSELPQADLVLAADGVHSAVRERLAEHFRPSIDWRKAKFSWLGTTKPLKAFTFVFKETPHGLFQVHAYPFTQDGVKDPTGARSTWILECREDVWRRAGLDKATDEETVRFCEDLFKEELGGEKILSNKSIWRTFPTIRCQKWSHQNIVLLGDSAHTAHFSIGSGTKLAMEDAIALVDAFKKHGTQDVPMVLAAYEAQRKPEVERIQHAAQTSLEWFENSARYQAQPPLQFTFNLMTRSKRITYENLKTRDPALVAKIDALVASSQKSRMSSDGTPPPPMFAPFKLRELELQNRVVVSPMCQYSSVDGLPNDWHLVHLGSRAVGGAGLLFTEMTDVTPEGRITLGCAGLWNDAQEAAWKRVVDFVHTHSNAKVGMQLAHAGRKGSMTRPWEGDRPLRAEEGAYETLGPSALAFKPGWQVPKEMDAGDFTRVREAFVESTKRAERAGFDLLELHAAHGYLLSSFLSPLSNQRTDRYGGSLENRMRFLLEIFDAVRAVWPSHKPISVRLSATDWLEPSGMTVDDTVQVARALKEHGCDVVDVSSAGNVPESKPIYGRMYQVPFAEAVKHGAQIPVIAVGNIQGADHVNTLVGSGRADLCALARGHLSDPHMTLRAAQDAGYDTFPFPNPYLLVKPRRPKPS